LPQTEIARPAGLLVLTLERDQISAMTWFADSSVFALFGLPRTLARPDRDAYYRFKART
jgi:RNA polymerase sigma-70 factor (ECF subfamily)